MSASLPSTGLSLSQLRLTARSAVPWAGSLHGEEVEHKAISSRRVPGREVAKPDWSGEAGRHNPCLLFLIIKVQWDLLGKVLDTSLQGEEKDLVLKI